MSALEDPRTSFRSHYRTALEAEPEKLHFAAHSHHLWPDCTREAQLAAWELAASKADEKWEVIQTTVLGPAKARIARLLGGVDAGRLCFAPNTHEFVVRLLSCFEPGRELRVLTTDGEFHSFDRQLKRVEEDGKTLVHRVPVEPFETFHQRWGQAAERGGWDFVYFSQVFFQSGFGVPDLEGAVAAVTDPDALVVVDGYHAFCALPVDLKGLRSRVFYMAGGYKYAQSGEGLCFLYVPEGCELRPRSTGWFAQFGALSARGDKQERVGYPTSGERFVGATMDWTAAYRFNAVQAWWERDGISVERIHSRVGALKALFLRELENAGLSLLVSDRVLRVGGALPEGHFITFDLESAGELVDRLRSDRVVVDSRGTRLRFGFGLYHDEAYVLSLIDRLKRGKY